MYGGGFYVISTNASFPNKTLPFEISESYCIASPAALEVGVFETNLKDAGYFSRKIVPFGSEKKVIEENGDLRTRWEHAETHDIYIIKFKNFNRNMDQLNYAGSLLTPKLRFTMQTVYSNETESEVSIRGLSSYSDLELMAAGSLEDRAQYSHEDLLEFKSLFSILVSLDVESRYNGVLQLFHGTDNIPRQSNLLTLSYFSTLEALLTNGRSEGESITNQLIYKTTLLLNMSGTIDHTTLFQGINYEKLWKKLYKLRSCIAHGNKFDFKNELASLKDIDTVNIYLDKVVQKLIIFSIKNQKLVDDLKQC